MRKNNLLLPAVGILCSLMMTACASGAAATTPAATTPAATTAAAETEAPKNTTAPKNTEAPKSTEAPKNTEAPAPEDSKKAEAPKEEDTAIIETVLDEFELLTQVPRPSHHEEKISEFLVKWAEEKGFAPVKDEVNNVMFDVPATEGMEDLPLCILQGHMDMVVAVADGKDFDPLEDPITVIRHEDTNTLTADGTSLGGDDGAGVAIIMAAAEGKIKHGPLRMLITVNEEDGMTGALNLDPAWLKDAACLINIDNETSDEVLVSTASSYTVKIEGDVHRMDSAGEAALDIALTGLQGGHSGVEIHKGRMNALITLAGLLKEVGKAGISYDLASFGGGTAANAIPEKASCTIVVAMDDRDAVKELAAAYLEEQKKAYAGIDDGMTLTVTEADEVPQVISEEEKVDMIRFLTEIRNGVNTWSADMEGLVESSSNLGLFSLEDDEISGVALIRSSVGERQTEIYESHVSLAEACGYETEAAQTADPWPYNPDSELLELAKEVYLEQNGEEIIVSAVHAGLECGTFAVLNPELDMISIGPDLKEPHTVRETLYLNSIPKVWKLLEGILARIGE